MSNLLPNDREPHGHRQQAVDVVGPRTGLDQQEQSHKQTYTQKHLSQTPFCYLEYHRYKHTGNYLCFVWFFTNKPLTSTLLAMPLTYKHAALCTTTSLVYHVHVSWRFA